MTPTPFPTFQQSTPPATADSAPPVSELDVWFPRPAVVPAPPPAPEPGVIAGARRPSVRKQYARRWYQQLRRNSPDGAAEGDI